MAESDNGVDNFRFWDHPLALPEAGEPDANVSDMRLTAHEDGWIYGVFGTERKDPQAPPATPRAPSSRVGIVRTRDLVKWERLADLRSRAVGPQSVALHPELVRGQYAFYTRAQGASAGTTARRRTASASRCARTSSRRSSASETVIDARGYQTIKEARNAAGAAAAQDRPGLAARRTGHAHHRRGAALGAVRLPVRPRGPRARDRGARRATCSPPRATSGSGDVSSGLACAGAVARPTGEVLPLLRRRPRAACTWPRPASSGSLDYVDAHGARPAAARTRASRSARRSSSATSSCWRAPRARPIVGCAEGRPAQRGDSMTTRRSLPGNRGGRGRRSGARRPRRRSGPPRSRRSACSSTACGTSSRRTCPGTLKQVKDWGFEEVESLRPLRSRRSPGRSRTRACAAPRSTSATTS